jgi:hypothetical protein
MDVLFQRTKCKHSGVLKRYVVSTDKEILLGGLGPKKDGTSVLED